MSLQRAVKKIMAPLERRVRLMVARSIIRLAYPGAVQGLQLQLGATEVADQVEHFQDYGFASVPLSGSEGIALFVGGSRAHGVVVAVRDRAGRPGGLQAGEVAIYTVEGDFLKFQKERKATLKTKTLLLDAEDTGTFKAKKLVSIESTEDSTSVKGKKKVTIVATDEEVEIKGGTKIKLDAQHVEITGYLKVAGEVYAGPTCVQLAAHIHPTPAGPSSPPNPGVCPP